MVICAEHDPGPESNSRSDLVATGPDLLEFILRRQRMRYALYMMNCLRCQHANDATASFCEECGTRLGLHACATCSTALRAPAKFLPELRCTGRLDH
jgi:predicted amidophosphoribosyltransferase